MCRLLSVDGQGVFPGQPFDECRLVGIFPEDHQQGVFAPECTQHVRYLQPIDGEGDAVPMAELGVNHRQVTGKLDVHDSPGDVIVEVGLRCGFYFLLDRVYIPLLAIWNPRDSEKLKISR